MTQEIGKELASIPLWQWILIALLVFSQSTWMFLDARKRGAKRWFWGIWALTTCPLPLIVYLLAVRKIWKRRA